MYLITATNFGKTMKFKCPTLTEANELSEALKSDGFVSITIKKTK